jgi:hydroxymethylpyrimidine kinase/phosphomethylpyrimidine kinase
VTKIDRPFVLSIGTTEPWASVGLELDAFIADRLGVRILTCVVAVSAQDGKGLLSVTPVPRAMVRAQLAALEGVELGALRIGALPRMAHVDEIADFLRKHPLPAVLDPVIATSSGKQIMSTEVLERMRERLFPHLRLLTPNLLEAALLTGAPVTSCAEMDTAAVRIAEMGPRAVLVKGGHLSGAPTDVLWDGERLCRLEGSRLPHDMRGTGCLVAMAFAAATARGYPVRQAVKFAREVVRRLLLDSRDVGWMRIVP